MRESATTQLRTLLVMIPWLAERGGATYEELSRRFDRPVARLRRDLEVAACCGLPPYTPDNLIELIFWDDHVEAIIPPYFRRPPRLDRHEALAVLSAGDTMLTVEGADPDGPLARALAKLRTALGADGGVALELDRPDLLDAVRDAAAAGRRLEIEYYAASNDQLTTRAIDVLAVVSEGDRWYVIADDGLSGERRHFRVDRIRRAVDTGERFEPPATPPTAAELGPGPDAERVTVDLPASGRWVVETYPAEVVDDRGADGLRVRLAVTGRPWLERLLLRVGPGARVVEPAAWHRTGPEAAERLLARVGP